jgi:hypothetical protein
MNERLPAELWELANEDVGVAVTTDRAPVIEVISELTVAPHHQVWFEAHARQTVVATRAAFSAKW